MKMEKRIGLGFFEGGGLNSKMKKRDEREEKKRK